MIIDELGPPPEEIIPHVPRALSPMVRRIPTDHPLINTYLIGVDEVLIINPGPADNSHFEAISGCGGSRLKWITSTSTHKNYAGGKTALAKELGLTRKSLKPGDVLQSTEFRLACHRSDDYGLILYLEEERVLFCNDLLGANKSDPIVKHCVSLTKKLKPYRIAPAIGQVIENFGSDLSTHLVELKQPASSEVA